MELIGEKKEKLLECIDKNINCFSLSGKTFYCKVVNVYDADTCKVVFYLNDELIKYTIRLKGIDTPEMKPPSSDKNRKIQIKQAKRSRNRLIQLSTDCDLELESVSPGSGSDTSEGNQSLVPEDDFSEPDGAADADRRRWR